MPLIPKWLQTTKPTVALVGPSANGCFPRVAFEIRELSARAAFFFVGGGDLTTDSCLVVPVW